MQPLQLGPLGVQQLVEFSLLLLVLVNMGVRYAGHERHVRQADAGGAEAISRYLPLEATTVVLVLVAFGYMLLDFHGGMIISVLALGTFISDFFEFEARKVEARREIPLDQPKAAIGASVVLLLYTAYVALFFLVEPFWTAIV